MEPEKERPENRRKTRGWGGILEILGRSGQSFKCHKKIKVDTEMSIRCSNLQVICQQSKHFQDSLLVEGKGEMVAEM